MRISATTHMKSLGFLQDDKKTYEKQVNSFCSSGNYQHKRIYANTYLLTAVIPLYVHWYFTT